MKFTDNERRDILWVKKAESNCKDHTLCEFEGSDSKKEFIPESGLRQKHTNLHAIYYSGII